MSKSKAKHTRSEKNIDNLLNDSFLNNDEKISGYSNKDDPDISKMACGMPSMSTGGCLPNFCGGMNMSLSFFNVMCLLLVIGSVFIYYEVMDNVNYAALQASYDWGPPEMVMLIGGVLSVLFTCVVSASIKTNCPDNCNLLIVSTIITILLSIIFPYIMFISGDTDAVKYAFWIMLIALILTLWIYFYTCGCLSRCARVPIFLNMAWLAYVTIWLGSLLNWNVF